MFISCSRLLHFRKICTSVISVSFYSIIVTYYLLNVIFSYFSRCITILYIQCLNYLTSCLPVLPICTCQPECHVSPPFCDWFYKITIFCHSGAFIFFCAKKKMFPVRFKLTNASVCHKGDGTLVL